jgi:hypothetical protein
MFILCQDPPGLSWTAHTTLISANLPGLYETPAKLDIAY